jgi:GxxExxY protein
MDSKEYVDDDMEPNAELNCITNAVIGAAIAVHRALGPGFLESMYQAGMEIELAEKGIKFHAQYEVGVIYHGKKIGQGWFDLLVDGRVIVELKAVESLAPIHSAQLISYLRLRVTGLDCS